MIQIKDKEKATRLRRELAAELSKPKIDPVRIQIIREEIMKAGYRCAAQEPHIQKQRKKKDAPDC